jgi:transposase
MSPGAFL